MGVITSHQAFASSPFNRLNECSITLDALKWVDWGIEKEINEAKLFSNDAGGKRSAAKRLRHHRNAKQPLNLLHFPSPLMAGEKLTKLSIFPS